MVRSTTPAPVKALVAKTQVGGKVADAEWLAAKKRENAEAERAALLQELEEHRAQGERHQAMLEARDAAEKAREDFEYQTLEPLRDAYAAYTQGRAQLTRLLDDYWDRWKDVATTCQAAGVPAPPDLNKWNYLHLADMEALGTGIVEPHVLHRLEA